MLMMKLPARARLQRVRKLYQSSQSRTAGHTSKRATRCNRAAANVGKINTLLKDIYCDTNLIPTRARLQRVRKLYQPSQSRTAGHTSKRGKKATKTKTSEMRWLMYFLYLFA